MSLVYTHAVFELTLIVAAVGWVQVLGPNRPGSKFHFEESQKKLAEVSKQVSAPNATGVTTSRFGLGAGKFGEAMVKERSSSLVRVSTTEDPLQAISTTARPPTPTGYDSE